MTPAEHYAEAERCLDVATNLFDNDKAAGLPSDDVFKIQTVGIAMAQVHATLATIDPAVGRLAQKAAEGEGPNRKLRGFS